MELFLGTVVLLLVGVLPLVAAAYMTRELLRRVVSEELTPGRFERLLPLQGKWLRYCLFAPPTFLVLWLVWLVSTSLIVFPVLFIASAG